LTIARMEKYKNHGRLIIDEKYYIPPDVDVNLHDVTNDPYDIEKGRPMEAHKRREKKIYMCVDRTSMYAYLISILSTSKVAAVIKKRAREEYAACKQGPFEHIMDYKQRFNAKLDALTASSNTAASTADIAIDFMYGLDNNRLNEFKAEVVNNMQ
jgi:hypothetical protein